MVDISAGCRPLYRPRYLPKVGRYVDHHSADIHRSICRPTHLGRHIDRLSTDMSTDISTDTRPKCRPIHRSTVGRYVGRYIGRGVHKIHMIQFSSDITADCVARHYLLALYFLRHFFFFRILKGSTQFTTFFQFAIAASSVREVEFCTIVIHPRIQSLHMQTERGCSRTTINIQHRVV